MTEIAGMPAGEIEGADRENRVPPKPQPRLGRRLKALRISRGLSLKEVAAETGVSASFLSMVETGRNEMTVGRLMTMADFYEVDLGDLIPERGADGPVVLRQDDRQATSSPDPMVTTEPLGAWHYGDIAGRLVRFAVGGESRRAMSPSPGPEFVLVLDGEMTIEYSDGTSVVLGEGDSIWFEASRRQRHRNSGDRELSIITFQGAPRPGQV